MVLERLSGRALGIFTIGLAGGDAAELRADWQDSAISSSLAAESLCRCLRMLFDNFGIGLVRAEIPPENQGLTPIFREHRFKPSTDGRLCLTREDWLAMRAGRKIVLVAAAALIDVDNRVLLARRPEGKTMAGQWEFPGGKLAVGETPEQALVRELHEELGIDVTASCLAPLAFASHDYDHFHLLMPLFALRQWSGSVTPREGQTLAWVAKDKLADYAMPPADIPLVAHLRDWL
jgi:8-oxo-dGTP diphosphatase